MKIGFPSLLALLFIGLKLTHMIAWSWVWVLSPLWIGGAIIVGVLLCLFLFAIVAAALETGKTSTRRL